MRGEVKGLSSPVYLDHHATTPLDRRVLEAMLPFLGTAFGNTASTHAYGRNALEAVERARLQVADAIGARPAEVVFTSGATESDNLAVRGVAAASRDRSHLVSCVTEHVAVLAPLEALRRTGRRVTLVQVDHRGALDIDALSSAVGADTALVSAMAANNEIGTLHPMSEIAERVHARGALLHSDAAQAVGKVPIDVRRLDVDLLSISAHKMYGPQGVGALYVRQGVPIDAQLVGGGHERGRRSGTLNVAGCVGLGEACRIAVEELTDESERIRQLRRRLHAGLVALDPALRINGDEHHCLQGCLNVRFSAVEADALLGNCPDVAFTTGSACASAAPGPSHVLKAIGLTHADAERSVRLTLGRHTTDDDIDRALYSLAQALARIGALEAASAVVA